MGDKGVRQSKRILLVFLVVTFLIIAAIGAWAVSASSDEHSVGPETVTLEPGDWIEIPIEPQYEWYTVRFDLDMECEEDLDITVAHGTHSLKGDPGLLRLYNKSIDNPSYGGTVLSTGEWSEEIALECDCACMLSIDNTPAGQVNQTAVPVTVTYELQWSEHKNLMMVPQFYYMIIFIIAVPIVGSMLWKQVEQEESQYMFSRTNDK